MSTISEINIKQLFGHFDYHIPLNTSDNITIIHGPNGCGKTWILKLVNAIFSLDYSTIGSAPFGAIEVLFSDGGHFTVRRQVEEHSYFYDPSIRFRPQGPRRTTLKFNYHSKRTKRPKEFSMPIGSFSRTRLSNQQMLQIRREFPQLRQIGASRWRDLSMGAILTTEEVTERYGRVIPPSAPSSKSTYGWLTDLANRVPVHFIQSQRLLRVTQLQSRRESSAPSEDVNMVELYSQELAETISRRLAESARSSQSKDSSFPTRLLRGEFSQSISEPELRQALVSMEQKRQRLYSAGMLDREDEVPLPDRSMTEMEQRVLSLYLQDVEEKLRFFDDLESKIAIFMNLVNSKFKPHGKMLGIDKDQGFIFNTEFEEERVLRPVDLSSGEQNELALFYELLFRSTPKSLFLIDEPEISLNVGWQRRFLDDLLQIVKTGRHSVIIATHSPQIIHNRWDLAVSLSGGIKE